MRLVVPPEFERLAAGVLVRRGFAAEVTAWLARPVPAAHGAPSEAPLAGGRGAARAVALPDGGRAWVRWYRHGGLLGGWLRDVYWESPPRPWRELAVTETARRAGITAPEVLAAAALPLGERGCRLHRAVLVTRELAGRRSLAAALVAAGDGEERRAWIDRAWEAIDRMHAAGIRHRDLNASNLLAAGAGDAVAVIDFDRAVADDRPVGALGRALARRRFARSVAKLGLPGLDRRGVARHLAARARRGAAEAGS